MKQCPSQWLDEREEVLRSCTLDEGHAWNHETGRQPQYYPTDDRSWGWTWSDQHSVQVRGTHAPDALAGWSPAAQDSIAAAAQLGIAETVQPPTPPAPALAEAPLSPAWEAVERSGVRERRAVLLARERQEAYEQGVARERADAEQRVFHWAASLTKEHDRLVAAKAAEVVRAGR